MEHRLDSELERLEQENEPPEWWELPESWMVDSQPKYDGDGNLIEVRNER